MKSPEQLPPIEAVAFTDSANAPTLDISQAAFSGMQVEAAAAPTQNPPEALSKEGAGAVTAAVWSSDKRVNGLYTTFHARNTWMSVAGVGWKRLTTSSDSAAEAMTLLAAHCRERNCRIDFAEEGGLIKEVYVW